MINRTGNNVLYSPITYVFSNEDDAKGFLQCVKGVGGRPSSCAAQWRCVKQVREERSPTAGVER
jgi:hypothetical protein